LATPLQRQKNVGNFVHNVTLWHVRVTTAAMESQQCVTCLLLRYIYDECISPATVKRARFSYSVGHFVQFLPNMKLLDRISCLQNKIRQVGTAMPKTDGQTEGRGEASRRS
jgi:hypothetical protein